MPPAPAVAGGQVPPGPAAGVAPLPTPGAQGEDKPIPSPQATSSAPEETATPRQPAYGLDLFSSGGAIDEGDLVSLATSPVGSVVRSDGPSDALVIGCAVEVEASGMVAVATSRIALCRANAAYGAIEVGDLLSPSPTAGMAMRRDPNLTGATIIGRAIEPLDSGTGLVRVLLGVR